MRWANFLHIYQPPAWNEQIVRRATEEAYRPILRILKHQPNVRLTMNITGSLIEQLIALGLRDVLEDMRALVRRGQVELVGSAMYHPILPLLPDDECRRQISLQTDIIKATFGADIHLRGFYPPEMAFDGKLANILLDLGFEWVIVDELASGQGIGQARLDAAYATSAGLGIVLRNRSLSDFLSFSANVESAADVFATMVTATSGQRVVVTGMDGENLGHHRHGVDRLWEYLVTRPGVTCLTVSAARSNLPSAKLEPVACSWSSQPDEPGAGVPFGLWNHPANPMHKLQWDITYLVIDAVRDAAADPNVDAARRLLDLALTSDRYWWASASPWWEMTIVIRETQKLVDAIAPLKTVPTTTKKRVAQLMERLAHTAEVWEKTGLAKKRQTTYLTETGVVRFLGGQQVR